MQNEAASCPQMNTYSKQQQCPLGFWTQSSFTDGSEELFPIPSPAWPLPSHIKEVLTNLYRPRNQRRRTSAFLGEFRLYTSGKSSSWAKPHGHAEVLLPPLPLHTAVPRLSPVLTLLWLF